MRCASRVLVLSLLPFAALGALSPVRAASPAGPPCERIDVSPLGAPAPVILCQSGGTGAVTSISTDGGRRFTTRRGQIPGAGWVKDAVLSPTFSTDHTIYVRTGQLGLFTSRDGGATYVPVDQQAATARVAHMTTVDRFGPTLAGVLGGPAIALGDAGASVYYGGLHVPVAGSRNQADVKFLQVGHGPKARVLVSNSGPVADAAGRIRQEYRISACDDFLACPLVNVVLPEGGGFGPFVADPAAAAKTVLVGLESTGMRSLPALWASNDAGQSFSRVTTFDTAVSKAFKPSVSSPRMLSAAVLPGGKTWLVAVSGATEALFITTDAGRTWRVTGRDFALDGRTLNTNLPGKVLAGGHTFACSKDQGKTWRATC